MKVGVLGGGQLGRMLAQAASPLDINISFLDLKPDYPALDIWPRFTIGDFTVYDDVINFGKSCDVVTVEIESVNIQALYDLQKSSIKVFPQPQILEVIADKGLQKKFYKDHSLPTSPFKIWDREEVINFKKNQSFSTPFVQKLRKGGYDGKGVHVVKSQIDIEGMFEEASVIEDLVNIKKELAIIVCRSQDGKIVSFPSVEMEFHPTANLVEFLFSPADISPSIEENAQSIASSIAENLGIVGLLAVELFLDEENEIIINEVAPRPHNSGHHTIEACYTSQYEQHLRSLMGWPLGSTNLITPAVMINLLGEEGYEGPTIYKGLEQAMTIEGVYPHLYGKKITKPKRKMGHVTILDQDLETAKSKALKVKKLLRVIS